MHKTLCLALALTLVGCSPETERPPTNVSTETEDGGEVVNPHRDQATAYFQSLTKSESAEEEKRIVTELAAWLNANEYKVEIIEEDGVHTLSCPYFPPVTPWVQHTFIDADHVDLLPEHTW